MAEQAFDLIVVGGGPGGYVAAIRAAQLGMKTAVVEREHLGGICLNWGCIPTKALLRSSEINHLLHTLDAYGFGADNIRFDIGKVVKRSRAVANQLSGGVKHLLRKNKVTVFDGHGKLNGKGKLAVAKDGKPVADLGHHLGHPQDRLGRDAGLVETAAADVLLLDDRRLHAELGSADRGHVAPRAGADHDAVVLGFGHPASTLSER